MREPFALKLIRILFPLIGGSALLGCMFTAIKLFRYGDELAESYYVFPLVLGLLGAIFLVIGVAMNMVGRGASKKQRQLLETGQRVIARIVDIQPDVSISVNGRHPYRLYCEYEEGGVIYCCHSNYIWSRPVVDRDDVSVYRDPDNYKQYYVDVESVMRPTVEL